MFSTWEESERRIRRKGSFPILRSTLSSCFLLCGSQNRGRQRKWPVSTGPTTTTTKPVKPGSGPSKEVCGLGPYPEYCSSLLEGLVGIYSAGDREKGPLGQGLTA